MLAFFFYKVGASLQNSVEMSDQQIGIELIGSKYCIFLIMFVC